jgi:hypothetical protein
VTPSVILKCRKSKSVVAELLTDMEHILGWVSDRLHQGDVPRVSDVVHHAHFNMGLKHISAREISKAVRQHPVYEINSTQQREKKRSRKYRPIVVNDCGHLHADIAFVSKSREYEIPASFRAGYLVARDVLTRYTFIILLKRDRTADSMIEAFSQLIDRHRELMGRSEDEFHGIRSVSFDKETSVMSTKVQKFLEEKGIRFFSFKLSSSKSKVAEGAIKIIRTTIARLRRSEKILKLNYDESATYWKRIYSECETSINSRQIIVSGKKLKTTPRELYPDADGSKVKALIKNLHKAVPSFYFSQFDISPRLVEFEFEPGTKVRAKLIVTSSKVLGNKTSEVSVTGEVFEVKDRQAYITRAYTVGKVYTCESLRDGSKHYFDEPDIVRTETEVGFDYTNRPPIVDQVVQRVTRSSSSTWRRKPLQ